MKEDDLMSKKKLIKEENRIRYFDNGDWIDLSKLKRLKTGYIDWINSIGCIVCFKYCKSIDSFIITNYDKKTKTITIIYKNKTSTIKYSSLMECKLRELLKTTDYNFYFEIGQILKDEKRDITITDRFKVENNRCKNGYIKKYKYTCNKCGYDKGEIYETRLKSGNGCVCCSGMVAVLGINTIFDTAPWMVKYVGEEVAKTHTCCSHKYIYPICPDCGRNRNKKIRICSIYEHHSIGCDCGDGKSYPEKFMFCLLDQLKRNEVINTIETEKTYDWCNYYNPYKNKDSFGRYDFVIENMKLIIEMDGEFHRIDNNLSGQTVEESQWLDSTKDKLAKENGYSIIRISNENDLKYNIIHSELNDIFDLSIIDWDKCIEFGCTNLMKLACKYKKENPNLTNLEISKMIGGVGIGGVRKWLIAGEKLNLCSYHDKKNT